MHGLIKHNRTHNKWNTANIPWLLTWICGGSSHDFMIVWTLLRLKQICMAKVRYSIFFQRWEVIHYSFIVVKVSSLPSGLLFMKQTGVLPQDLVKSLSHEVPVLIFLTSLFQSPWNLRGRDAFQITEQYEHDNIQSRLFETSRDLARSRLTA